MIIVQRFLFPNEKLKQRMTDILHLDSIQKCTYLLTGTPKCRLPAPILSEPSRADARILERPWRGETRHWSPVCHEMCLWGVCVQQRRPVALHPRELQDVLVHQVSFALIFLKENDPSLSLQASFIKQSVNHFFCIHMKPVRFSLFLFK